MMEKEKVLAILDEQLEESPDVYQAIALSDE